MSKVAVSVAALLALGLAQSADAMTLYSTSSSTCASVVVEDLRFSLSSSTACMTDGNSNPTASGFLTTNASFNGLPSGNKAWSLSLSFWNTYGAAVIALRADPDDGDKEWVGFLL